MSPALNRELQRPVESGKVVRPESIGLPFSQTDPDHAGTILNLVIERHSVTLDMEPIRQRIQLGPNSVIHQLRSVQRDPGSLKFIPAPHPFQLAPDSLEQSLRRQFFQAPAGSTPELVGFRQDAAQPVLVRVSSLPLP